MFRVEPHQLLFIYAGLGVFAVFFIASLHVIRRARRERAALRGVLKCRLCAFRFRAEGGLLQPRCPNCGALVDRKRPSLL